jgi:hypothetical protein
MDRTTIRSLGWVIASLVTIALLATMGDRLVAAAQTRQTEQVMRQKLTESQQLLAALVTSNWAALDRHTRALRALTNQPGWNIMREPMFLTHTMAFQKAVQGLTDAAGKRDQLSALAAYNGVVSSCVECHRYVGRARIARAK